VVSGVSSTDGIVLSLVVNTHTAYCFNSDGSVNCPLTFPQFVPVHVQNFTLPVVVVVVVEVVVLVFIHSCGHEITTQDKHTDNTMNRYTIKQKWRKI